MTILRTITYMSCGFPLTSAQSLNWVEKYRFNNRATLQILLWTRGWRSLIVHNYWTSIMTSYKRHMERKQEDEAQLLSLSSSSVGEDTKTTERWTDEQTDELTKADKRTDEGRQTIRHKTLEMRLPRRT